MTISKVQLARRITLGISLIGVTALAFLHQRIQGIPSIDALDPFGGLETLLKFVAGGEILKKIEPGTIVLFGAIVVIGIVLSRFFAVGSAPLALSRPFSAGRGRYSSAAASKCRENSIRCSDGLNIPS